MLAPMLRAALALVLALSLPACSSTPQGSIEIRTETRTEALSAARLAELPQVTVEVAGKSYTGPRLRDVLSAGGAPTGAAVEAIGDDGYAKTIAAEVVGRDDVVVALGLPAEEGLRVVVPGSKGLSVRRLAALKVSAAAP